MFMLIFGFLEVRFYFHLLVRVHIQPEIAFMFFGVGLVGFFLFGSVDLWKLPSSHG